MSRGYKHKRSCSVIKPILFLLLEFIAVVIIVDILSTVLPIIFVLLVAAYIMKEPVRRYIKVSGRGCDKK